MNPQYFKADLTPYEAEAYVKGLTRRSREAWEQSRFMSFCILSPWNRDLKPDDLMSFPWEDKHEKATMSEEEKNEIEQLRALAHKIEQEHHGKKQ